MEQKRQTYHHKDLRNALIETGIQLVSTEGINAFSLRKVAAACGVSHAAPYSCLLYTSPSPRDCS